jgi:hypothetical protein
VSRDIQPMGCGLRAFALAELTPRDMWQLSQLSDV